MKQMDDKEIIKTAECCLQTETWGDCYHLGCPCNSINGCVLFNRTDGNSEFDVTYEIIKELLGVINRQQEQLEAAANGQETLQKALAEKDGEIERLTTKKEQLIKTFGECQTEATRALLKKDRNIEHLNKEVDRLSQCVLYHDGHIEDAKSEAVREFAERLKGLYTNNKTYDRPNPHTSLVRLFANIENLVKEMAGEV